VLMGTAPDSLDPDFGYTTQAAEADNMVYTSLVGYAFKQGSAGTVLQPYLATAMPTVSKNQLVYTMTLRSGLTYSNGSKVMASDVTYAIERSIKLSWGGSSFYTDYIQGAAAYGAGQASSISGIQTDDSTGKITITLIKPYGAFDNVLSFPSSAPIPSSTPMKVLSNDPPVGIGPYMFSNIVPNVSFTLVKDPSFASFHIPGIPVGSINTVQVTIDSNTQSEAQQVLDNQADIFDPGDTLPASVLPTLQSKDTNRYKQESVPLVDYFFLNTRVKPFNNAKVRTAVNMAIDRTALARLSSASLNPGCSFLPPGVVGYKSGACSFGNPSVVPSAATIAKAKSMIKAAGDAGTKVTVWSLTRSPLQQFCEYYAGLLKSLGFNATLKVVADSTYYQTVGNESLNAQTGFYQWSADPPLPSDYYLLLSKAGIEATNNENVDDVVDPKIEVTLKSLDAVSSTSLASTANRWKNLDSYVSSQAYLVVFGYGTSPKLTSTRVNYATAVFNPVNYLEYNTVSFK
jgi:peptide/nickel transport system substrate-binding protein